MGRVTEFWRAHLGFRVFILFIISYVIFWGFFMELGLALLAPFAYWYLEKKFQKKEEPKSYRRGY